MSKERKGYINQELYEKQISITRTASYVVAALVALMIFVCYFILDVKEYLHVVLSPIVFLIVLNTWLFRFHKNLFYTFLVLYFLSLFGIISIASITGGIDSPFMYILIILPIGAFITSKKQGRYWVIISIVCLLVLYIMSITVDLPNIINYDHRHEFALILNVFTVIVVSLLALLLTKSSYNAFRSKDEIQQKNKIIEEKNNQIMDSISYAKRIQEASLPTDEYLKSLFKEYFIYYQPKDIVSGDFYWAYKSDTGKKIWIAADCTGHGVPGAFMSLIGTLLLNDMVVGKKICNPIEIAELLSNWITQFLEQKGSDATTKDGMDIMICCLDEKTNVLNACGAYNSLYIIRNKELVEYKGSKRAIGYNHQKKADEPFVLHTIQLEQNDILYTFSDGYVDQKGGADNKKFFSKRFKDLLMNIHQEPLSKQKEILAETMKNWISTESYRYEQMDDMLIFGVKID